MFNLNYVKRIADNYRTDILWFNLKKPRFLGGVGFGVLSCQNKHSQKSSFQNKVRSIFSWDSGLHVQFWQLDLLLCPVTKLKIMVANSNSALINLTPWAYKYLCTIHFTSPVLLLLFFSLPVSHFIDIVLVTPGMTSSSTWRVTNSWFLFFSSNKK